MSKTSERVGPRPRQFYFLLVLPLLLIPDGDQGFLLLALRGRGGEREGGEAKKVGRREGTRGRKWVKKVETVLYTNQ